MSTALVPLAPADETAPLGPVLGRTRADFLALLIATSVQAPQTRARRRAEPREAIAAYGAQDRSPRVADHALVRSL